MYGVQIRTRSIVPSRAVVAPSVVGVGQYFYTILVVNGDDVTLQVLLEVESVESISSVGSGSVLHSDGGSAFVIQVDQQIVVPRLADDLGAVQRVDVLHVVDSFARSYSVGVVDKLDH